MKSQMEREALKESIEILGDESVCSINGKVVGLACRSIERREDQTKRVRLRKRKRRRRVRQLKSTPLLAEREAKENEEMLLTKDS